MAFQAVVDTTQIDVIYTLNGETVQNSFYARLVGGYTLADIQSLVDQIDFQVGTVWLPLQSPEAIYVRSEIRGLAVENDITASQNANSGPGIQAAASCPNQVTLSIKKTSGLTGRSARGRTFWISVPLGQLQPGNENLVLPAWSALVVAAIATIRLAIPTILAWEAVLVSRVSNGVPRTVGITFPWVGEINVDDRVDTLRNRLPTL